MKHHQETRAPAADADRDAVRAFMYALRIACDDLHDEPFSAAARATLMELMAHSAPEADAAFRRIRSCA